MSGSPVSKPPVRSYGLLPDGTARPLLLVSDDGSWTLPFCESKAPLEGRIGPLVQMLRDSLGAQVVVLRQIQSPENASVYLLENLRPGWTPPQGQWMGREELPALPLAVPEHRPLLERWFVETDEGVPAIRNAWERPGWFTEAGGWMLDQLSRLGLTATGPVEQYRTVSISCLLRVPTSAGALYLKTMLPIFGHEPALVAALSELYPSRVPQVLATDLERRWFLMREFHGGSLFSRKEIEPWEQTVRLLARIQVECSQRTDWLLSLGCHDRRLDRLAGQIDALFADTAALTPTGSEFTPAEIDRLRDLAPRLKQICAELAAGPVPQSLVHGDLHGGNIAASDDEVLIYDWTDGCVAHPFLDLITLIKPGCLPEVPDAYTRLRAAYLEAWTACAPMDDLIPLFEQAQLLGLLHQAISYQGITNSVEAKGEWASGVPDYLRSLLRRIDTGAATGQSMKE
jgi:hypothetical protein